jgi:hypothetical protein
MVWVVAAVALAVVITAAPRQVRPASPNMRHRRRPITLIGRDWLYGHVAGRWRDGGLRGARSWLAFRRDGE